MPDDAGIDLCYLPATSRELCCPPNTLSTALTPLYQFVLLLMTVCHLFSAELLRSDPHDADHWRACLWYIILVSFHAFAASEQDRVALVRVPAYDEQSQLNLGARQCSASFVDRGKSHDVLSRSMAHSHSAHVVREPSLFGTSAPLLMLTCLLLAVPLCSLCCQPHNARIRYSDPLARSQEEGRDGHDRRRGCSRIQALVNVAARRSCGRGGLSMSCIQDPS